jgi:hypothetical protein
MFEYSSGYIGMIFIKEEVLNIYRSSKVEGLQKNEPKSWIIACSFNSKLSFFLFACFTSKSLFWLEDDWNCFAQWGPLTDLIPSPQKKFR